ncbi:MAG: SH3 domain-containing protein [Lachnospiraceae bacterium]|nr:SH3 domain-containing protein [Lachnospiraceae bacterium]
MDKIFYNKSRINKILVCTSAAMLFVTAPAISVYAAENTTQNAGTPAETPVPQESQPATVPSDSTTSAAENIPTQTTTDQNVAPQAPADTTTATPQPEPSSQDSFEVTPMQGTFYVIPQKGLNIRSGPSTTYASLGKLKYGQSVSVTGKTADNWYQIQYSNGIGYILADYVSATPVASTENPVVANPVEENPVTAPTAAEENPDPGISEDTPPAALPDNESVAEPQTEDDSPADNFIEVTSPLLGTPILVVIAIAILGVLAMICYSVYSLFRKDNDAADEDDLYSDDEYYEDDPYSDDEYYEDNSYADDEYYEDNPYSDDEYYEDDSYSDDEYYEDDQYPDDEYYEDDQYPDDEYYEDTQYPDDEYYEDNDNRY